MLPGDILLMAEILHQWIGSIYYITIIYRVLYIPGNAGFLPSTVGMVSYVVVSNRIYFLPYLDKIHILTHIFRMG